MNPVCHRTPRNLERHEEQQPNPRTRVAVTALVEAAGCHVNIALQYAARGWAVFPILPGDKRPDGLLAHNGLNDATLDTDTIHAWWAHTPGNSIGIRTGTTSGFWVLDIDEDTTKGLSGGDSLHDLEQRWGSLPPTVEALTPRGGRHLLFTMPNNGAGTVDIRNGQSGKIGAGLDVRANGGYVVAVPSIGANGRQYQWADSCGPDEVAIAQAPEWLLELVAPAEPPARPPTPINGHGAAPAGGEDGPAARYNHATTWPQLLESDGWTTSGHLGPEGDQRWTRPGKDLRDGPSATTGYQGRDVLKVFTSSLTALPAEWCGNRFQYLTVTRYNGDASRAASDLRAHEDAGKDLLAWIPTTPIDLDGDDPEGAHGWEPVDLVALMDTNYEPPKPTILARTDGRCLLYAARINQLLGESGSGKSWIALAATAQQLHAGHAVLYIDYEDHPAGIITRLIQLGVPAHIIASHLTYISPELAWNPTARDALEAILTETSPTLAVIDSTGESMSLDGVKPNDDDAVATWHRNLPRWIAHHGPAVLLNDHIPKAQDAPTGFAIGSQRKRAAIDGASYRVDVKVAPAKGAEGHLTLTVAKDRAGYWQHGKLAAQVTIIDSGSAINLRIIEPTDVDRPTVLMERVSRYLEENGASSKATVEKGVTGSTNFVRKAVDVLVIEDWVEMRPRPGKGGGFELISTTPYRDDSTTAWVTDEITSEMTGDTSTRQPRLTSPNLAQGDLPGDDDQTSPNLAPPFNSKRGAMGEVRTPGQPPDQPQNPPTSPIPTTTPITTPPQSNLNHPIRPASAPHVAPDITGIV